MTYHEMEESLKTRLEECLKEVRMKNKENILVPIESFNPYSNGLKV